MSSPIALSIIIVSYNTKKLTSDAIDSIRMQPDWEIIVVDNASSDGSVEYLQERFEHRIKIIQHKDNGGFAVANNEGIKQAQGSSILLLNSDTQVHVSAIENMLEVFSSRSEYGILSARLQNPDGSFQPQGGALPTLINITAWWLWPFHGTMPLVAPYQNTQDPARFTRSSVVDIGWVGGTAMLLRRQVVDQIGNLDSNIFMYAEDVEYCLRATRAGWKIGIVTAATITHLGSASGGSERALVGEVKGLLYLFGIHTHPLTTRTVRIIFVLGACLRWLLFGILYQRPEASTLYGQILRIAISGKREKSV